MKLDRDSLAALDEALAVLEQGFASLPELAHRPDLDRMRPVLREVALRMQDNFPYAHPLYAGQMLKPPHPVARLAYALSLWVNPNNHALDGGRASSASRSMRPWRSTPTASNGSLSTAEIRECV